MTAGRCVGCLVDADCPAPMVCDGTTHGCVECTATETENCGPDLAGKLCLGDGRCGCALDSDCGGLTSGRVCDPESSRCVPGCRGTGGNRCPAGQPCSSTTDAIGRCNGALPTDGGTVGPDGAVAPDAGAIDAATDGARDAARDGGGDASSGAGGRSGDAGRDATTGPDAGGTHDGGRGDGAVATPDAGRDAGGIAVGANGYIAGGGCNCSTGIGGRPTPELFLLCVLGAVGFARRRRR
jgi:MYXO-CTERM domain-containing protein